MTIEHEAVAAIQRQKLPAASFPILSGNKKAITPEQYAAAMENAEKEARRELGKDFELI